MIAHIVTITFTPETPTEHIRRSWEHLQSLQGVVPTLRHIVGGTDLAFDPANAQLAFMCFFDDQAGWADYQQHPAHQAFAAEYIRPHLVSRCATQFEWTGPLPQQ